MATTEYDFNTTRNKLIEGALRLVGGIYEGQSMSAYQLQNGVEALNQLVKAWQNKNCFLWTQVTETISLVVSQKEYTISQDPGFLSIDKAYFRKNDEDLILDRMSWPDYQDIQDKDDEGEPLVITVDPNPSNNKIVLWPVPNEAQELYILKTVKLKDFDSAGQTDVISPQWELALKYALAFELSFEYAVPAQEKDKLERRANNLFIEAKLGGKKQIESDITFVESAFRTRRC